MEVYNDLLNYVLTSIYYFTIFFKVHDNFSAETWFLHIRILTDPVSYGRKYETLALFQDLKNASFTSHSQAMWYACYLYVCV